MSAASDFLENELLDHALATGSYTAPAGVYVGLFTSSDSTGATAANLEAGTLTNEVSGNGYSRESASFGAATGGSASNSGNITFTASGGNWGTITHVAVHDASSAGNVLFYGALTTPKTIEDGDSFQIATSNLTISLA
jgi:hypothetical protein